ncbi:MAG: DUF420 domain-containing protein [Rhodospirillaceae bacterium]
MLQVQDFTHVIAGLNALSVVFLIAGYVMIRSGRRDAHRACMLAAVAVSALFLVFYVIYKANSGFAKFGGEGWVRTVYFSILIAHVLGAIAITPLVPWTLVRALKGRFEAHKSLAHWTWPLWVYVGVSGVVVYVMAVHLFPTVPAATG